MKLAFSAKTDVGVVRDHNEDNFTLIQSVKPYLLWENSVHEATVSEHGSVLVVADGMGGVNAGEIASEIAIKTVNDFFNSSKVEKSVTDKAREKLLKSVIQQAYKNINTEGNKNSTYDGMGTTIILAWIIDNKAIIAWSGDSRCYLLNKTNGLKRISDDHSLVFDLVRQGKLSEQDAEIHPDSHIISQCLGHKGEAPKPDTKIVKLDVGDVLYLCSDGLNGMLTHAQMEAIILDNKTLNDSTTELIETAKMAGGTDNITVVMAQLLDESTIQQKEEIQQKSKLPLYLFLIALLAAVAAFLIQYI